MSHFFFFFWGSLPFYSFVKNTLGCSFSFSSAAVQDYFTLTLINRIIGHKLPECGVFCGGGFGCGDTTMVVAQFGIIGIGRGLLALGEYGKNKAEI